MPAGRPSKYDPAFCERVIENGRLGYSKAELAADLDVTRATMDSWTESHPEFLNAVQRAHELSLAWWEAQSRSNLATSGFQAALWGKAMSGRFPKEPYRERTELTGKDGGPVQSDSRVDLTGLSPEQLRALASIKLPADA